ncbi:DUF1987 domain-containing protein [Roseospirillum parvum]|uniref:SiaC family regulatory phosphoprotein domain-containing protein n=1 Tax=Roseospirillum parvum TaxID=83401 RepID=A0A1G7X2F8_9PROT|nr:DUF1987 domain-containing protein [Roseospirillum parvum]SDG78342.1 protein of unknown function [Roseospirillum parvum]
MEPITLEATKRCPEINFDFAANTFLIKGESYPEDVDSFYGEIIEALETHLESQQGATIRLDLELIYFNSSTAKVLMELFEMMDAAAERGNDVLVAWHYEADDDNMEELGGEFAEELAHARFELKVLET